MSFHRVVPSSKGGIHWSYDGIDLDAIWSAHGSYYVVLWRDMSDSYKECNVNVLIKSCY